MHLPTRTLLALGVIALVNPRYAPLAAQPVVVSDLIEAKAIVESVDLKTREVLLRGDHGELETIMVSPEVRNLAQVHPGDYVMVSVHRAVALEMSKAGTPPVTAANVAAGRALPGSQPGAFRITTIHARVQIQGIDLDHRTVSFVGPARILRVVQIADPKLLEFVRGLHVGDEVDVTYRLGVAVAVVRARG